MGVADARPLGVGEILDAGIKVYLRNARLLMGLAAVVVIPLQAISWVVLLSIVSKSNQVPNSFSALSANSSTTTANSTAALGADVVLFFVGVIGSALVTAACVKAVSDIYLGQPTSAGESLRFAARRVLRYLVMQLLNLLGLTVAFLLLIVPGIWLYGAWSVSAPALLIEDQGPAAALGRSRRLVKGRWFPTAGVVLVAFVMSTLVSAAIQGLLVGAAFISGDPTAVLGVTLVTLAGTISAIVATPFTATVHTILYYDLRVRREGYDVDLLAEQLGIPAASLPASSSWSDAAGLPVGPESVGQPGGPPFWPPPPGWKPGGSEPPAPGGFDPPVPGGFDPPVPGGFDPPAPGGG